MTPEPRYWFRAKRYGYGWGLPSSWQGWVVLGTTLAMLAISGVAFPPSTQGGSYVASVVLVCMTLIGVCYWKGEPPKWRWGKR